MRDRGPHVLFVDDDPSIREALAAGLSGSYIVHPAATGAEACAILRAHPIAAIVLNLVLGDEDGLDFVDRFRAISHAPILILTGHSTEHRAVRALRAGASDLLQKPVGLEDLHGALARLVFQLPSPLDPLAHARLHLAERTAGHWTAKALAAHVGLSERQLRRRFQGATGNTLRRYLMELRAQLAARLLGTTPSAVRQVAHAVGQRDLKNFARFFRRVYGVTPSEFRAGTRREGDGSSPQADDGADGNVRN